MFYSCHLSMKIRLKYWQLKQMVILPYNIHLHGMKTEM